MPFKDIGKKYNSQSSTTKPERPFSSLHAHLTHMRIRQRYSHIFSSKSSKFHLWCAEIGTQCGTL